MCANRISIQFLLENMKKIHTQSQQLRGRSRGKEYYHTMRIFFPSDKQGPKLGVNKFNTDGSGALENETHLAKAALFCCFKQ
jgi:hypothetical protein